MKENESDNKMLKKIHNYIENLSVQMEKIKIAEYVELLNNPKRLLYINFLLGLARGFGMAIGFTLLGAFGLYVLTRLAVLNLPVIGDFITEVVRIVQDKL